MSRPRSPLFAWLLATGGFAACAPLAPAVAPGAPADGAVRVTLPKVSSAEVCADSMAQSRLVVERAASKAGLPAKDVEAAMAWLPSASAHGAPVTAKDGTKSRNEQSLLAQCFETVHGVWAIAIEEAAFSDE